MSAAITARGLRRTYGRGKSAFEAVRGVDIDVAEGEVFALLGTNGAGKTSTLELLEGLARPDAGEISVLGLDPIADRARLRPELGVMLQSGGLPRELTVGETLRMWRGTCSHPTSVDEVLGEVGLEHRRDVRVAALSGGESRRLDLACALLGRPRVLFLDEPTTGLDPESRRGTWRLLARLKAAGVTMVLTTHYLDEAEALADRVSIMHAGVIARSGTLREIVDGHRSAIAFDAASLPPGTALPHLPGAEVDADGPRIRIQTPDLQRHLYELLAWAASGDVTLTGLDARAATLESVFLGIADGAADHDPIGVAS